MAIDSSADDLTRLNARDGLPVRVEDDLFA